MLKFRCRECDQKIGVPEEWAGHDVRCPRCRSAIPVPKVIDAVVQPRTEPIAAPAPRTAAPPKAPLTPMPSPGAKPGAASKPAVKAKPVAKPIAGKPIVVKATARPAGAVRVPPAAPKKSAEPIVTQAPDNRDFSSLFVRSAPQGVGPADVRSEAAAGLRSTEDQNGAQSGLEAEARDSGRPFSEMMDVLRGPEETGLTSNAALSDMVKGLSRQVEPAAAPAAEAPAVWAPAASRRGAVWVDAAGPPTNALARSIGSLAMLVGVGALSLCVTSRGTRFAFPVGAAGLLLAVLGAMVPARRRGTEVALALGGSAISATGLVLAILVATGIVPSAATAHGMIFGRRNVAVARSGDVEVKVVSATVLRPVVYPAGGKQPQSQSTPLLRIGIEARNLGSAGSVAYKSWGTIRPDSEPVILSDDEGNQLKLIDPAPLVPVGRPREFPAALPAKSRSIADVLLFEVPPAAARELVLQLPGANVEAAGGFDLHIPAGMLRKQ